MTEPASGSTPYRRRGRRFLVVAALLLVAIAGWRFATSESVSDRARTIQVGQPRADVLRLMGQPQMTYGTASMRGECYSEISSLELTVRVLIHQFLKMDVLPDIDSETVRFEYDADGRVARIFFPD
ncbi:hypothetical protein Pan44_17660 [Caulifigura coniformis]|uniref:SmpA / OmlA family protein n=1 Tax=Caulifigura coniformis TaxID=2527983 RepID=A0A517SC99_9PLAN|nr:hypothetical protein [Caulifigura coniformis]QDT53743.1 hypothetical protein Pan44_17660 [Caulifigura coniformis]